MTAKPYGLYCPTSKACEVLMPRWTMQILGELWGGSSRFNDIRRGLPGISPTLLAKRLKEMQESGLVERVEDRAAGTIDYFRTDKAAELDEVIVSLAKWAQKHIKAEVALEDRNADLLMWNVRRQIDVSKLPPQRNVMRFNFSDATSPASIYWVICKPGETVELCASDPGFEVDLFVETSVEIFTAVYLGRHPYDRAIDNGTIFLSGDARLIRTFRQWMIFSMHSGYQEVAKLASAG